MIVRVGKPHEKSESGEKRNNWFRFICLIVLVVLLVLIILEYSVVNLPERYQAFAVNEVRNVLILDTVKGHIWHSVGDIRRGIHYQGRLKVGEKVEWQKPESP